MLNKGIFLLVYITLCANAFQRGAIRFPVHTIGSYPRDLALYESSVDKATAFPDKEFDKPTLRRTLDKEFLNVALPAFVGLAADPVASIIDAMYVARLGAAQQAGMGIAISAQFTIAKLYNDPLEKTSTSLVAGKTGEDLEASAATSIATATVIGTIQCIIFSLFGSRILRLMGVQTGSDMMRPALEYLKWRAMGIPAATMILATNGIFRGRGDTKTPLLCTSFGNIVNIVLDPILIFSCNMGCAGAGAATAISQWAAAIPLLYLLNKNIPIKIFSRDASFFADAARMYFRAGGLIFLRTIAKLSTYNHHLLRRSAVGNSRHGRVRCHLQPWLCNLTAVRVHLYRGAVAAGQGRALRLR